MRNVIDSILVVFILLAASATAQVTHPLSAKSRCGVSSVHQVISIADGRQHSISLDQRLCQWETPITLAGLSSTEYTSSGTDDVQDNAAQDSGYVTGVVANGDRYFIRYKGSSIMKDGVPVRLQGVWSFTGGTGKLRGLSGRGTYTAQPTATGEMLFVMIGGYRVLVRPPHS